MESNDNPPTEHSQEEQQLQEEFKGWVNMLAQLAVAGGPFFQDEKFFVQFPTDTEIIKISITRAPNNIIQFPTNEGNEQSVS